MNRIMTEFVAFGTTFKVCIEESEYINGCTAILVTDANTNEKITNLSVNFEDSITLEKGIWFGKH